jgi:phosphatidylglycerophosphatase A
MQRIRKTVATLFSIGYVPFAPGSIASLAGVAVYLLVRDYHALYYGIIPVCLVLGVWASSRAEKEFPVKDPPQIVIDEFASLFIVYLFIPFETGYVIGGFFLYRIFDILKPPPLRRLERIPGGYGIMLDDVAAAVLANMALRVFTFFR